jgi:hypothetical protein
MRGRGGGCINSVVLQCLCSQTYLWTLEVCLTHLIFTDRSAFITGAFLTVRAKPRLSVLELGHRIRFKLKTAVNLIPIDLDVAALKLLTISQHPVKLVNTNYLLVK